jgi:hypothetical protein
VCKFTLPLPLQLKATSQFRSMIFAAKTNMDSMRPTDRSKVSRAVGKLQYQDEDLCVALVRSLERDLHESPPIAVAGIMAGLGQVAYRCAARSAAERSFSALAPGPRVMQLPGCEHVIVDRVWQQHEQLCLIRLWHMRTARTLRSI